MDEFYGKSITITGPVKYIGEGEDPADNPYMIAYANALKELYQPERSKREDSYLFNPSNIPEQLFGELVEGNKKDWEMRCSELYGNIERPAEMIGPPRNRS